MFQTYVRNKHNIISDHYQILSSIFLYWHDFAFKNHESWFIIILMFNLARILRISHILMIYKRWDFSLMALWHMYYPALSVISSILGIFVKSEITIMREIIWRGYGNLKQMWMLVSFSCRKWNQLDDVIEISFPIEDYLSHHMTRFVNFLS
jgi:hypothetical protein